MLLETLLENINQNLQNTSSFYLKNAVALVQLKPKLDWIENFMKRFNEKFPEKVSEVSHWGNDPVTLSVYLRELDSFQNPDFMTLLDVLDTYFCLQKCNKGVASVEDSPTLYLREYKFATPELVFNLAVYLKHDSELCRRIQVGTSTIEVPKYELICQ